MVEAVPGSGQSAVSRARRERVEMGPQPQGKEANWRQAEEGGMP